MNEIGGVGHSSEAFGFLAFATLRSANRWICGFAFGYAQICPNGQTSHIPSCAKLPEALMKRYINSLTFRI